MGGERAKAILQLPALNGSVVHLLKDKVRFSAPLRIRILENNDRADRTADVIEIKKKKSDMPFTITGKPFLDSHLTTG